MKRKHLFLILRICAYVLLLISVAGYALSFLITTLPPRQRSAPTPGDAGFAYEELDFESADGLVLRGWLVPHEEARGVILLAHGLGAEKSDLIDMVPFLHRGGYALFLFDFRGHGESEGDHATLGYLEQRDLEGALACVSSRQETSGLPLGLYGISMGAAPCVLVAARRQEVRAVVAESCYDSLESTIIHHGRLYFHLPAWVCRLGIFFFQLRFWFDIGEVSPLDDIGAIGPRGVLLVSGEKDERMPPRLSRELYRRAVEPKGILVVPGAAHGQAHFIDKYGYEGAILEFYNKHLK